MGPNSAKINAMILFGPVLMASVLSFTLSVLATDPPRILELGFILGFSLFLSAKVSILRKGNFFSIGWNLMSQRFKKIYLIGYIIMIVCALLSGIMYFWQ